MNSYTEKGHLTGFFYSTDRKIQTRIGAWKRFGTNYQGFYNWIKEQIPKESFLNGLDVGCGTGELASLMDFNMTCVDLSPKMIDSARKANPKASYLVADAQVLPFDDCSFSIVFCTHMLYHVIDIKKAISELIRVTKRNGVIMITAPRYHLDKGLNRIHYSALNELGFPQFMSDKEEYCRFTAENACSYLDDYKEFIYRNDLRFTDAEFAMEYYESAMMYRNSYGPEDDRIDSSLWPKLRNNVINAIKEEIAEKGFFESPGEVSLFIIRKEPKFLNLVEKMIQEHRQAMESLTSITGRPRLSAVNHSSKLAEKGASCYDGVNIGLTGFRKAPQYRIISAHGTSVKKVGLKTYSELLKEDFAAAKKADPSGKMMINYDLFCGKINSPEDFGRTKSMNLQAISGIFGVSDEEGLYRFIVSNVASVFRGKYPIVFEIPGSRGESMFPDFTAVTVSKITRILDDLFPEAGLCIDLSHVLTFTKNKAEIIKVIDIVKDRIRMLHLSSAGSYRRYFRELYKKGPDWHAEGLDLMLPVDEQIMIELLEYVRSSNIIEVCEARTYGQTMKDYFWDAHYDFEDDRNYSDELMMQAEKLGYCDGKN